MGEQYGSRRHSWGALYRCGIGVHSTAAHAVGAFDWVAYLTIGASRDRSLDDQRVSAPIGLLFISADQGVLVCLFHHFLCSLR